MNSTETYIFRKYYQKSLNYLFPLLGQEKEDAFRPTNTYLWWSGKESIETLDLIVHYEDKERSLFDLFEKKVLMKSPYLDTCYTVEGGRVYIFSMAAFSDTVSKFLHGKYSQFEEKVKKRILSYHGATIDKVPRPNRPFHTALYPELYWEQAAREIKYPVEDLKQVGELCSLYEKEKETFDINIIESCANVIPKEISLDTK